MKIKYIFSCLLIALMTALQAQNATLTTGHNFGKAGMGQGKDVELVGEIDGEIYAYSMGAKGLKQKFTFMRLDVETMEIVWETSFTYDDWPVDNGIKENIKIYGDPRFFIWNGAFYGRVHTEEGQYLARFSDEAKVMGPLFKTSKEVYEGQTNYEFSDDREYMLIESIFYDRKFKTSVITKKMRENALHEYMVINKDFEVVNQYTKKSDKLVVSMEVDNDGNIYLLEADKEENNYRAVEVLCKNRIEDELYAVEVVHNGLLNNPFTFFVNFEGDPVLMGYELTEEEGKEELQLKGFFQFKIDAVSKTVKKETEALTFSQHEITKYLFTKKKKPGHFSRVSTTSLRRMDNGNVLFCAEFGHVKNGQFYYGSLLFVALDKQGKIRWKQFIPKKSYPFYRNTQSTQRVGERHKILYHKNGIHIVLPQYKDYIEGSVPENFRDMKITKKPEGQAQLVVYKIDFDGQMKGPTLLKMNDPKEVIKAFYFDVMIASGSSSRLEIDEGNSSVFIQYVTEHFLSMTRKIYKIETN